MIFTPRVQTVGSIRDFMTREKTEVINSKGAINFEENEAMEKGKAAGLALGLSTLPLIFSPLTKAVPASAAVVTVAAQHDMYNKMVTAFDPLINLIQGLAYPVAMVVILGGSIMVMINQKEKGYSMMMGAGLGYVLVQMTPMILRILVDAMKVM